jgi:hypothetical protein
MTAISKSISKSIKARRDYWRKSCKIPSTDRDEMKDSRSRIYNLKSKIGGA